jgi:hypothetical protein
MYDLTENVYDTVEKNNPSINWIQIAQLDLKSQKENRAQADKPVQSQRELSSQSDTTAPARATETRAPRDVWAAIKDVWVRDNFYQTNRWTSYSTIDRNLTDAMAENRSVIAHNDKDAPNGLLGGDYLVVEYQANKNNPKQAMITLASSESSRPYVTSRPPAGVEDLGNGRVRMNLDTFNGLFEGLRYQSRAALDNNPTLRREMPGNVTEAINDVRYGDNSYNRNAWTRYATIDRSLIAAMKEQRGVIAERWVGRYYPRDYTSDGYDYLVVAYQPNPENPQAGMVTLARDPSRSSTPTYSSREEHLRYVDVQRLENGCFQMSLKTFNTIFHGLRYENKRTQSR